MNEDELRARGYDPHIVKVHIVKGTAEEAAAAILWASLIKIEGPMSRSWSLLAKTMNEVAFLIGRNDSDITEDIARRQYVVFAKSCAVDKLHRPYKGSAIYEIEDNQTYISESGFLFRVLGKARHGQDCSEMMIHYTNLEPTADMPAGEKWVIAESIFLKRFYEVGNGSL
jgi:hypothetical protein